MISDEDVIQLYRCLLGRPPENADTIKAFRAYYPTFEAGRGAILGSEEFRRRYRELVGRPPPALGELPAILEGLPILAAAPLVPPAETPPQRPAITRGYSSIFTTLPDAKLAVILGEIPGRRVADMLPWQGRGAVVLQLLDSDGPAGPQRVDGTPSLVHYRLHWGIETLASLLSDATLPIDALIVAGPPAAPPALAALRPLMAPRAVVSVLPPEALEPCRRELRGWTTPDMAIEWRRLLLFFLGGWHLPVSYEPPAALPEPFVRRDYPSLAVAAIVRNEARCIINMMTSVLPIVSQYVIVDTGSTDDTLPRVRHFLEACGTPAIVTSIEVERFDAMRNAALDRVAPGIDWVLMLDADEELVTEDHLPLLELIRDARAEAYALPRYNFRGGDKSGPAMIYPDRQVRLLRNTPERRIRYSGVVHEKVRNARSLGLAPLDASVLGLPRGGPHIHHLVRRFRTPEEEEAKQARYRELAARFAGVA